MSSLDTATAVSSQRARRRPAITAPVSEPRDVEALLDAGASELYCGVQPRNAASEQAGVEHANRRDDAGSNLRDYRELESVVRRARARGADVFLALNNHFTAASLPLAEEQIERAAESGVAAFIVADAALLPVLAEKAPKVPLHLSSVAAAFNGEALAFWRERGFARAVLPRHLTEAEMAELVRAAPGTELEVLVMNDGCHLVDGHCGFLHPIQQAPSLAGKLLTHPTIERLIRPVTAHIPATLFRGMLEESDLLPCHLKDDEVVVEVEPGADAGAVDVERVRRYHLDYMTVSRVRYRCALCSVGALARAGVRSLKVAGRRYALSQRVADVRSLAAALDLAEGGADGEPFVQACEELFEKNRGFPCKREYCYFAPGGWRGETST